MDVISQVREQISLFLSTALSSLQETLQADKSLISYKAFSYNSV